MRSAKSLLTEAKLLLETEDRLSCWTNPVVLKLVQEGVDSIRFPETPWKLFREDDELLATEDRGDYILHTIRSYEGMDNGRSVDLTLAFTRSGYLLGEENFAERLKKRGIVAQTGSIGWCEKEQKWYGWSHRAMYGFGIGDEVEEGDLCAMSGYTDEYIAAHPEADKSLPVGFKAKTLDDAKLMAQAFARAVS
jgi:hypothetical protein